MIVKILPINQLGEKLIKSVLLIFLSAVFSLSKEVVILDTGRKIVSENVEISGESVIISGFLLHEVFDVSRVLHVSTEIGKIKELDWEVKNVVAFRKAVYERGNFDKGMSVNGHKSSFFKDSAKKEFLHEFTWQRILLACFNFLVPSLGSWLIGDWESGVFALYGLAVSTLITAGTYYGATAVFPNNLAGISAAISITFVVGAICLIGIELFNIINPFVYSAKQINKLKKTLDKSPHRLSVSPAGFRMAF